MRTNGSGSRLRVAALLLMIAGTTIVPAEAQVQWSGSTNFALAGAEPFTGNYPVRIVRDGSDAYYLVFLDTAAGKINVERVGQYENIEWLALANQTAISGPIQGEMIAVTDGDGGLIVVYAQTGGPVTNAEVYAQRIDADGNVLWGADGIALDASAVPGTTATRSLRAIPDHRGGAIIGRRDKSDAVIVEGITHDGASRYEVTLAAGLSPGSPDIALAETGEGDAFVVWSDYASRTLYVSRLDKSGIPDPGSPQSFTSSHAFLDLQAVSDGAFGFILATENGGVRLHRFNAALQKQWGTDGVLLSSIGYDHSLDKDGSGGAVVAYQVYGATGDQIRVQRLNAAGSKLFGASGTQVNPTGQNAFVPRVATNGRGGAMVLWSDDDLDLFAQEVDDQGTLLFLSPGVQLGELAWGLSEADYAMKSDGAGGLVTFYKRVDPLFNGDFSLFGNRLSRTSIFAYASKMQDPADTIHPCPTGIADTLRIDVTLDGPGSLPSYIAAEEIEIKPVTGGPIAFFDAAELEATGPATAPAYGTQFLIDHIGGGYVGYVEIHVLGEPAGMAYVGVRSPDFDADGRLTVLDVSIFAMTNSKCPTDPGYDWRVDLVESNPCINLADLGEFSYAYNNSCGF